MSFPYCRLLPFHVAGGAWNMAADEALLETAAAGTASFRLYGWTQPTLSLGYFQPSAASRAYPRLAELDWVRRPSGGAALVHHFEGTYALALPAGLARQKPGAAWLRTMHEVIRDALAAFGISARLCGDVEERKQGKVLCFLHHTPGDLLIGESKIAGSAQRRQRGALLQHGGILLAASPYTPRLVGIQEAAEVIVTLPDFCAVMVEVLHQQTRWQFASAAWTPAERRRIEALAAEKYSQTTWNGKR